MQETISISKGGIVVAETQHKMVLSTTEANNGINLVRIRQGDVLTQKFVVEVVEHGKLKTFDGLVPFFINTTKFGENQPVEQKVQEYSPSQARFVYTLSEPDWQWGGENTAHFSFRSLNGDGTWSEQFSTQDFTYRVISGISRSQLRDSGYVWTFEDLLRKFKDYMNQGKSDWEQWLEDNRELLENIDPGGTIINILNEAKGNYESLADRLNDIQNKKLSVSSSVRQITDGGYSVPSNFDEVIAHIDHQLFNVAFITDTHVDGMGKDSAFTTGDSSTNPRRWSTLARFKEMAKHCDVTVYGGDNCDCNSGRTGEFKIGVRDFGRTHSMAIQKRFANFASVWKKDVIVCRGNHDTGKIPYAWIGHTPETCLNSADMHHLYNGTFGGRLFPDKGIAIYRIDTDDYSDALDSNGQYKEFSGHTKDGEIGKIGAEQLKDFGTFLTNLDRSYHVLLVGHIPLDDSATGVWNTAALRTLIDGFKQGVSVTIDYDSLTGEPSESVTGSEVFDFSTKGPGVIIAYICGHEHWETVRNLGTLKMIVGTCAFTKDTSVDFEAFYQLSIDKTARRLIVNGVGRATKRSFSY